MCNGGWFRHVQTLGKRALKKNLIKPLDLDFWPCYTFACLGVASPVANMSLIGEPCPNCGKRGPFTSPRPPKLRTVSNLTPCCTWTFSKNRHFGPKRGYVRIRNRIASFSRRQIWNEKILRFIYP